MSIKLTKTEIENLGFRKVEAKDSPFQYFQDMPYYVKDSVILFFNEGDYNENSFLLGYGEMRQGVYFAVSIRWISTLGELHEGYTFLSRKVLVSLL